MPQQVFRILLGQWRVPRAPVYQRIVNSKEIASQYFHQKEPIMKQTYKMYPNPSCLVLSMCLGGHHRSVAE